MQTKEMSVESGGDTRGQGVAWRQHIQGRRDNVGIVLCNLFLGAVCTKTIHTLMIQLTKQVVSPLGSLSLLSFRSDCVNIV